MTSVVYYNNHEAVDSTAISDIYFDSFAEEMYVQFHNGTIAGYGDVDYNTYEEFIEANSIGRHYAGYIKGVYPGINGDVDLRERLMFSVGRPGIDYDPIEPEETSPTPKSFKVMVEITGELTFTVEADGFSHAESRVRDLINKSLVSGAYDVRSVTDNSSK